MTHAELAQALLGAVRAQHFEDTPDARQGGGPVAVFPSLDLAVAAFPPGRPPVWASVLFSRDVPEGVVAEIPADAGSVQNVAFVADVRDTAGVSIAWLPGADWSRINWTPLHGHGPHRFVVPYPASLCKLMVAVGVGIAFDAGVLRWEQAWTHAGRTRSVEAWCADMITLSCNDSTTAMVALLHAARLIAPGRNVLHARFEAVGLPTLRLDGTRQDGGWGNAAGAGVGGIQMTAWDTVRLLWTLDPSAGAPPWPAGQPLLSPPARDKVLGWLRGQQLHHVLGLPAEVEFAHKTGTTENYASDAGIVQARAPRRRHYLVALLSNLGSRYAPGEPEGSTPQKLRQLGAAVDALMRDILEDDSP